MTPSKAILIGCGLIAGAVVVSAALLLSEPAPPAPPPSVSTAPAPPTTATPAQPEMAQPEKAAPAPGRYQIVKVENGASWRLDTATGEMTFCRVEGDRMICAKSTQSTELPKASADELKAEREQAKTQRAEKGDAIFERFMGLFDRLLRMIEREAEKGTGSPAPTTPAPSGESGRSL